MRSWLALLLGTLVGAVIGAALGGRVHEVAGSAQLGAGLGASLVSLVVVPLAVNRWAGTRQFRPGFLFAVVTGLGALVGGGIGVAQHDLGPNLFAGAIMAAPLGLYCSLVLYWVRSRPAASLRFARFLSCALGGTYTCALAGFWTMGLAAALFRNRESDSIVETALTIGAGGGALCGLMGGCLLGTLAVLWPAKASPEN